MNSLPRHDIGIGRSIQAPFDTAVARVEAALTAEGFGVMTRIDVKATLKEQLGVDVASQVILGACNPKFAHDALKIDPRIALLLPCNVVVRQEAAAVRVEAIEPYAMTELFPDRDLNGVAGGASDALRRAIAAA
jgi:uncharacterized protein (DUF302 family)